MTIQFKYAHFKCTRLVGGVKVSSITILQLSNSVSERLSTVLPILILNKRLVDLDSAKMYAKFDINIPCG